MASVQPQQSPAVRGAQSAIIAPFRVDPSLGTHNGAVSSQWFSRPADQRFLNLDALYNFTRTMADQSRAMLVDVRDVKVLARDSDDLRIVLPKGIKVVDAEGNKLREEIEDVAAAPNHHSFGQLCSLLQAPASYLRKLPAQIAGINLQYAVKNFREETVKAYVRQNGEVEMRAATGPDYGRVYDYELVDAVRNIVAASTGLTNWKVPGVLDWSTNMYDPMAPVTSDSTTLFASDRDVFMFLVDDTHPIEIGKFPAGHPHAGEPDLLFRGFYAWNSEVGDKKVGVASFYLRAVCMNRNLWGVEGFQEVSFRHSRLAPARFAAEVMPALESFAHHATDKLIWGVNKAKEAVVAKNLDEQREFLKRQKFSDSETTAIIDIVMKEEGHPAESIWDFVQGITAVARGKDHTDARLDFEKRAGKLLDKVAA